MVPLDFWHLANRLLAKEKNPEGFRSAISRAYYAAYLTAVDFLSGMEIHLVGRNKHEEAQKILSNTGDPDIDKAGTKLAHLRDARNTADYDLSDRDVEKEQFAVLRQNEAGDIVGAITTCLSTKGKGRYEKVAAGITQWVNKLRGLSS